MTLRTIVFVGLRVYAIYFAVQVLTFIPALFQTSLADAGQRGSHWLLVYASYLMLVAIILWSFAARLARCVTGNDDHAVDKMGLSQENVYTFAFVFLGLYFILSTIGSTLQQLYYVVAVVAQLPESDPQRSLAFFQLYSPGITLIAGFASLLGAPFWARKLVKMGAG